MTKFIISIISAVLTFLVVGFTLSTLWNWFATPILGLPHLSLVQAYAINLVWSYLSLRIPTKEEVEEAEGVDNIIYRFAVVCVASLVFLLTGCIVRGLL